MPVAHSDDKCRCGRSVIPPHCTKCGSTNVYARDASGGPYIDENGLPQMSRGYRCRKCREDFNTQTPCTLPYFEAKATITRREREDNQNRIQAQMEAAVQAAKTQGITDQKELNRIKLAEMFRAQGLGALVQHTVLASPPTQPVPEQAPRASDEDNYVDTWPPREDNNNEPK